jgi:tetratricopeptide (TPR) repeat protein
MRCASRPGRVTALVAAIACCLALILAALPALAQGAAGQANPNARPDGWLLNYGQPSYSIPDTYRAHYERGVALAQKLDYEGAARELLECLRLFEPYVAARVRVGDYKDKLAMEDYATPLASASVNLGHALRQMGRLETAVKLYTGAADIAPGYVPAHESLGSALVEQGIARHAQRQRTSTAIGDVHPDEVELNLYRLAVAHLHVARQLEPNNPNVRVLLSVALRRWGVLDGAIAQAEKAIELDPTSAEAQYNLGLALTAAGKMQPGIDALKEAARLASSDSAALQAEIQNALGLALAGIGDFNGSLDAYALAADLQPDNADYRNNLGAAMRAAGKPEQAKPVLMEAAALNPGNIEHYLNLAASARDAGDLETAVRSYRQALRLDTKNTELHHQLALALYQRRDPDIVFAGYNKDASAPVNDSVEAALATIAAHFIQMRRVQMVDAMDPRSYVVTPRLALSPNPWPKLQSQVAAIWQLMDRRPLYGESRLDLQDMLANLEVIKPAVLSLAADYDKVLQVSASGKLAAEPLAIPERLLKSDGVLAASAADLAPEVRLAVMGVARALRAGDDLAESIAEFRWAQRMNPRSPFIVNNLGKALFDAGEVSAALAMYSRAIQLGKDLPEAYFNRGVALARLGRIDEAMGCWDKAYNMDKRPDVRLSSFMGQVAMQRTEFDYAEAMFQRALRVDDGFAPVHYYRGLLLALRENASPITALPLENSRLATKIGRRHYDVRAEFITLEELEPALAELRKADSLDPDRKRFYDYVGVELGLQDPALAPVKGAVVLHAVARMKGLRPDWASVTNNIAVVAALDGDAAKAEKLLKIAVRDEPDYALAHWNLGRVQMAAGREGEGKQELWKAVELARKQGLPYFFEAEKPVQPKAAPAPKPVPAPMPRLAITEYPVRSLLEAFDIPVPVL